MVSYLKIEIFAYDIFHTAWLRSGLTSFKYDATQMYKDECLLVTDIEEVCDTLFYDAVTCRMVLFQQIYLKEMRKERDRFWDSLTDFYDFIESTCNRCDWFGFLTVFERMLSTCAFVLSLCFYNHSNENIDFIRLGHICWAKYFHASIEEFYKQGGWSKLKNIAASYSLPSAFNRSYVTDLTKAFTEVAEAIENYINMKQTSIIHEYKTVSMLWVKFHINDLHRSSNKLVECADYENCIHAEYILSELKRLCSPSASEVLEYDKECSERQVFISDSFSLPLTPESSQESIDGKDSSSVDSDGNGEVILTASSSDEGENVSEFVTSDSDFEHCSCLVELEDIACRIHCDEISSSLDALNQPVEFESICIISDSEQDQNLSSSMTKMQLNLETLKLEETTISEMDFSSFTNDRYSIEGSDTKDNIVASQEMTSKKYLILHDSLDPGKLDSNTSVKVSDLSFTEGESVQNKGFKQGEIVCVTTFSNVSLSYDNQESISIAEWDEKDLEKNISTPIKQQS